MGTEFLSFIAEMGKRLVVNGFCAVLVLIGGGFIFGFVPLPMWVGIGIGVGIMIVSVLIQKWFGRKRRPFDERFMR